MNESALLLFCLSIAAAFDENPDSEKSIPRFRIMYGENAEEGRFPYQTFLMVTEEKTGYSYRCGGSIIHKRWILTVAHCLKSEKVEYVEVGSIHHNAGIMYAPEFQVFHKAYYHRHNDIGLIRLTTNLEFNEKVQAINLPKDNTDKYENKTATEIGWGKTESGKSTNDLKYTETTVINLEDCAKVWLEKRNAKISDMHICTMAKNKTSCSGDSGGPIVVDGMQVGIVSFGYDNVCTASLPSVNTRISHFLPWIREQLKKYNDEL